jgi:hypothetical protein
VESVEIGKMIKYDGFLYHKLNLYKHTFSDNLDRRVRSLIILTSTVANEPISVYRRIST